MSSDVDRVAVPLGPARVHAQQHLGEVGRVDPAGLGADRHQRLAGVVLARQQGADLEHVDGLLQRAELVLGLDAGIGVVHLLGEVPQRLGVVDPAAEVLDPLDLALHV